MSALARVHPAPVESEELSGLTVEEERALHHELIRARQALVEIIERVNLAVNSMPGTGWTPRNCATGELCYLQGLALEGLERAP